MNLTKTISSALLFAGLAFAGSASALVMNNTGSTSGGTPGGLPIWEVVFDGTDQGSSFDMHYTFNSTTNADAISAKASFLLQTVDLDATGEVVLVIDVENNSTGGDPKITSFGFNTNPDIAGAALTTPGSTFDLIDTDTNFPGFSTIDVCLFSQGCSGGAAHSGLASGDSDQITVTLTGDFSSLSTFTMSDFAMKFQAIESYQLPGSPDDPNTPVPAPATLALLALGLLGVRAFGRKSA